MQQAFRSSTTGSLLQKAADWLADCKPLEALILASTRGAADDFARRLARSQAGCLGLHRFTLYQLAIELATPELAAEGKAPVSALGFEALCTRVVHQVATEQRLAYFDPVADLPGFARALSRTLRELDLNAVNLDALADSGAPGKDLARLQKELGKELEAGQLTGYAGILRRATQRLTQADHRFHGMPVILLSPTIRHLCEENFLKTLADLAQSTLAIALEGDRRTLARLPRVLGCEVRPLADAMPDPVNRLGRLRTHLFKESSPETVSLAGDESVTFFSEPGEARECVEIARRIRFLAEQGTRFDQVAILLRNPTTYLPLIVDALRRAGVPGYYTRGTIRPDPSGRAFLALLHCGVEGLSASRFAEYLSLGEAPFAEPSGEPPSPPVPWVEPQDEQLCFKTLLEEPAVIPEPVADLDRDPVVAGTLRTPLHWEKLLVDASVIGGRDRWEKRLAGLAAEIELQVKGLDKGDLTNLERLQERRIQLAYLSSFALPLIDRIDRFPEEARWSDWLNRLEELAMAALRTPETVLRLLADLRAMSQVGPVSLAEVTRVLTDSLTSLRDDPPSSRYGRVFVATITEATARSFKVVFLPGLAEGIFPQKAIEDPLLLDIYRKTLGLESEIENRRVDERMLLRTAIAAAEEKLIVSYPRMDTSQGRPRVPSFYALDVLRAAEGELPNVRRLEKQAASASRTKLGWPAPVDPQLAIDDAEYDLAMLAPLLAGRQVGRNLQAGAARFLLGVNPHLERSLRNRWWRWSRPFTAADGLVDPDPSTLQLLGRQRLRTRSYSPTALQQFAVCPYKFFLYAIHRLQPREEAAAIEQMDPLTRGALFHEVQFELFLELSRRGLLPVSNDNESEVGAIAEATLTRVADQYREDLAPAMPRVWQSEVESLAVDLRGWIREVVAAGTRWVPERFEFAFGLTQQQGRDPGSRPEAASIFDGFKIRGSIDLLERNPRDGTLRVTDHKTGRAPSERALVVRNGEVLQPLLYGLAAEALLQEPVETGRLFYCTRRGEFRTVEVPVEQMNCGKLKTVLDVIDGSIEEGFLPAAPRAKGCEYCDYRLVCGPYEELRVSQKRPERLAGLIQIRKLP